MPRSYLANALWRKSSLSGNGGADCVEVAVGLPGVVGLRDSKDSSGPVLVFSFESWRTFVRGVKSGDFDDLG
ncbi:DUF397 domain-containing protein [Streptosporangium sp. NPDC049078]|uniref:DUF397 domain-containing protein n=1 Tax=Streptosporangium sp. NPDC049078 TaxID=3155767 RepID=UPI003425F092